MSRLSKVTEAMMRMDYKSGICAVEKHLRLTEDEIDILDTQIQSALCKSYCMDCILHFSITCEQYNVEQWISFYESFKNN